MKFPNISKKYLKRKRPVQWKNIRDIANRLFVRPSEIIDEINDLGKLINQTLLMEHGCVYFKSFIDSSEVFVDYLRTRDDLIRIGLQAYYSWTDYSFYSLQIYDGTDRRWIPGRHVVSKESVLDSLR